MEKVDPDGLLPHETVWVAKQPFLASKGYHLRPRFQPNWVPSWVKDPTLIRGLCEDRIELPFRYGQIDATTTDGQLVYLKQVRTDSEELKIAQMFSSPLIREDPRNHCVPVLDAFPDNEDETLTYIVMPYLHDMNQPDFYWVGDVVDFVDQVLEGLAFMHQHAVAHRDCAEGNIMMEATSLFPNGHHPVHPEFALDLQESSRPYTRFEAPTPVRYFFLDFGLSSHIQPGSSKFVVGVFGQDREVPELSATVPYDAFKLDIFILGNVLRRCIYDRFHRVGFLKPLIREMIRQDPVARPEAEAALAHWKRIRSQMYTPGLILRLRNRREGILRAGVFDVFSLFRLSYLFAKRFAGWSVAWMRFLFCA